MLSSYLIVANRPADREVNLPAVDETLTENECPWVLTRGAGSHGFLPPSGANRVASVADELSLASSLDLGASAFLVQLVGIDTRRVPAAGPACGADGI